MYHNRSGDRLSAAYLIALAGRLIREVGGTAARVREVDTRLPVLALDAEVRFRSPADRAAFADELSTTVVRLVARYHDEGAPDGAGSVVLVDLHPPTCSLAHRPRRNRDPLRPR